MDYIRELFRAHEILSRGNPGRAARKLHRLARHIARDGDLQRAAAVTIEAANDEAAAGMAVEAVQSVGFALDTVATGGGHPEQLASAVERVAGTLRSGGHAAEAASVEGKLKAVLQAAGLTVEMAAARVEAATPRSHGDLPASCPACGGPLLPDEVEWRDATTALCTFCGSVVKATP